MNFRSVLSYTGTMLEILGILCLVPVLVSWYFGDQAGLSFVVAAIISFAFGTVLDKHFNKSEIDLGSAMTITAVSFILISLFGALPFLSYMQPVDAVFESVSGFTTTGLSVINLPETMPQSLVFWRSFTQWIGGIGILVIFLMLMGSPGISSFYLYKAEGAAEKLEAGVKHSVSKIFKIYGFYTVLGILLLYLAGLPVFDSLVVAFSSISTGGFAPHSASMAAYQNNIAELIVMFLMVAGATSFFVHDRILRGRIKGKLRLLGGRTLEYSRNPETQFFWVILAAFFILLSVAFWGFAAEPLKAGIFHTVSALTTTGFTTVNIASSQLVMFLIILLMIIGGYAGSTSGGLKLVRVGIIAKSFSWIGRKMSYPQEAVIPFKFGRKLIKEHTLAMVFLFVCIYLVLLVLSGVAMMFLGYSPMDGFFIVSSAQGTVGFSTIDLAAMAWQGKVLLMINMMLGRLEIFPFVVLLYSIYDSLKGKEKW